MNTVYENIKRYRLLNKWSQHELALKVGYKDKTMISRIESGKIDLPLSKVEKFAEIFRVRPSVLMGWEEESPAEKNENLINKYEALDKREKEVIDWLLNRKE